MAYSTQVVYGSKRCIRIFREVSVEPAVFLYMFTSFVHISVFQSLLYEKASKIVWEQQSDVDNVTTQISEAIVKRKIQTLANHTFLLSTICLLLPSLFVTAICGSLSDLKYDRKTLVLPFIGLILADANYIVQSYFIDLNIYLLLISDVCFGVFGGFTAILGGIFSYSARFLDRKKNSCRIASMEACIGFGGTMGFVLSGVLRRSMEYYMIFLLNGCIHLVILIYMIVCASSKSLSGDRSEQGCANSDEKETVPLTRQIAFHFKQLGVTLSKRRPKNGRKCIILGLIAFCFSYFLSNGAQNIMFFYFKHRYSWSVTEYGLFRGIYYGVSSLLVLLMYPFLKHLGCSDLQLALAGILARLLGTLTLGLAPTGTLSCITLLFFTLNRFNATGLRCMLSAEVGLAEQGKMFAVIAITESVIGMLASLTFNTLFPLTLSFYSGFCYILISVLFVIPVVCIIVTMRTVHLRTSDVISCH